MERDIKKIETNPELLKSLYGYRLPTDHKEKLHQTFLDTFIGTKKYNNYSSGKLLKENEESRYMIDLTANEFMYVNKDSYEYTNSEDPDAIEYVHFYIHG